MARLKLDPSFGFVEVEVGGQPVKLDVWEAYNTYAGIRQRHGDDAVQILQEFADWLGLKGLPGLSHGAANAVAGALIEELAAAKKADPCSTSAG